jgi:predicted enzyme related to lactoylglutathione lyase
MSDDTLGPRLRIVGIICVERVIVAVRDLAASCENWRRAGFAVANHENEFDRAGIRIARLAAGAVEIDLCAMHSAESESPLSQHLREATSNDNGGGIVGWVWGVKGACTADERQSGTGRPRESILLPGRSEPAIEAAMLLSGLPGVITAAAPTSLDIESRRQSLSRLCGSNANSVDYLEHIVVMTPVLEDAIAAHEAIGVPCKRIREVGNGVRQAFFKLEQTVLEIVGPARGRPGCWGFALMCSDIARAVATARAGGLQATEPKLAIQGGQIARIVEPLDGVAIAFMQSGPRRDD